MPAFNEQQKAAIYADNPFLLCAAGAGSGKTTVMVESVARKLADHPDKDISGFLIITFTNEAAGNMKRKIQARLLEDSGEGKKWAIRAINNLENASISTIHAFCKNLIASYFYAIPGMPPKFDILDEAKLEQYFAEAYETALEDICDREQTAWTQEEVRLVKELMHNFSQTELPVMLRDLYNALMGIPEPFSHLDRYVENMTRPLEENPWAKEVLFAAKMDLAGLPGFLQQEKAMLCALTPDQCAQAALQDEQVIGALLARLQEDLSVQEMIDAITAAEAGMITPSVRKPAPEVKEWNEAFKKLRSTVKGSTGILRKTAALLQMLLSPAQLDDNQKIARSLQGISILLKATAERFRKLKLAEAGIDYSDMEQMAYALVKREDIREAVTESISDIYVDECQDVSAIQYAIVDALTGGEGSFLCRVGDIKQSIYGFRSAAPDLMERDILSYDEDPSAQHRKIFFQDNYRSCRQIIECINEVFDLSMERSISEIDYTPQDHLRAHVDGAFGPVEVILLNQDAAAQADMLEAQCRAAGDAIRKLVSGGGYAYRDIVILIQNARTDAPVMVDHFRRMHIPVLYDGGLTFYGLTEISSFLDLLAVIDNDHTDVELIGTLRNVPFSFSDADLAAIRESGMKYTWFYEAFLACCERNTTPLEKRCAASIAKIRAWREEARTSSVAEFVWTLLRRSGIYAARGAYPDGKLRQLNLDTLCQRAVDLEKRGVASLSAFLREIRQLKDSTGRDTGDTPAALGAGDNFVRLMTMHKSKGLEFPAVILMNLQKDLRTSRNKSRMKINVGTFDTVRHPLGVYLPAVSMKHHTLRHTFGQDAFRIRKTRTNIAEDTRLLYVAMTRAMQKLILIGHYKEKETALWSDPSRTFRIWSTRSMLDLVMPAVLSHLQLPPTDSDASGGQWDLRVLTPQPIAEEEEQLSQSGLDQALARLLSNEAPCPESMWLGSDTDNAPLKTSVTSLLRKASETVSSEASTFETSSQVGYAPQEEEETVEVKRRDALPTFLLSKVPPRPAFMMEEEEAEGAKASAADIGSLTHRFLRLIDLSSWNRALTQAAQEQAAGDRAQDINNADCLSWVAAELDRLREQSVMTKSEADAVYVKGAAAFLESSLGQRLAAAKKVHREWPFTMQIREDSPTMVQGIVDAAFLEDGQWILIDYKTDRDTRPEVFVPRHEMQMNWYREAVERLTQIPVKEMWLFALRSGKAFPVQRRDID